MVISGSFLRVEPGLRGPDTFVEDCFMGCLDCAAYPVPAVVFCVPALLEFPGPSLVSLLRKHLPSQRQWFPGCAKSPFPSRSLAASGRSRLTLARGNWFSNSIASERRGILISTASVPLAGRERRETSFSSLNLPLVKFWESAVVNHCQEITGTAQRILEIKSNFSL